MTDLRSQGGARGQGISGPLLVFALLGLAQWRPDWAGAFALWYFQQCQALAALLVSPAFHK